MIKNYPIEFVRQIIVQRLFMNKGDDPNLIGGDKDVNLMSFFEQVKTQEELDRYVKNWQALVDEQNRDTHIVNGIVATQENPTITNLYNCLIIPMTWNCIFRCKLKDMDLVVNSVSKLIESLKGRKQDIAEFEDGSLYMVGTIGNYSDTHIRKCDYIGSANDQDTLKNQLSPIISSLGTKGFSIAIRQIVSISYFESANEKIKLVQIAKQPQRPTTYEFVEDFKELVEPPESNVVGKYKVSMSCDAIRVDTPTTINGEEYVNVSFSGSATIVNDKVKLGNDLVHIRVKRDKVIMNGTATTFSEDALYLEPLEMPSGNNISTQSNQISTNNFKNNHHNDSITPALQYTFICDDDNLLLRNLYDYGRYGIVNYDTTYGVSPNIIYEIKEVYSSWGKVNVKPYNAKIIDNVEIENNEADVLTISITFAVQGGN